MSVVEKDDSGGACISRCCVLATLYGVALSGVLVFAWYGMAGHIAFSRVMT